MRRGRGSARDALSALDQVVASGSADAARPELAAGARCAGRRRRGPGAGRAERAAGRRLGPAAAGDRADRRPPPGLPRRAGARAVRGVRDRRSSGSRRWPRRWDWPGWCAAWRSWVTRWSTCGRRPTPRWCSRSPPCVPCGRTSTREWRRCRSGSACSSASRLGAPPPSPVRARPPERRRVTGRRVGRRPSGRRPAPAPSVRPAEVGRRPSIGAVRRSQGAAALLGLGAGPRRRGTRPIPRRPSTARPPPGPTAATPSRHGRSRQPDRGLGRRHPAYPAGTGQGPLQRRRSSRSTSGAHFALPNAAHRDQCAGAGPRWRRRSPRTSVPRYPGARHRRRPWHRRRHPAAARPPACRHGGPGSRGRRSSEVDRRDFDAGDVEDGVHRSGIGRRGAPPAGLPRRQRGRRLGDVHRSRSAPSSTSSAACPASGRSRPSASPSTS